jgi:ABC-type Na+ efflux pump permease subunit
MTIVTVGIDLAKNVFAVHGVDEGGKPALVRPSVPRVKLLELIATLPPCLMGMEACCGAHNWARCLAERRGYWRAIVAIAAKNARMCWAVLKHGEGFKMPA